MKLNDIDMLVNHRKEYEARAELYQSCLNGRSLSLKIGDVFFRDVATLEKVKALLVKESKVYFEEAKTKLMMLGVDSFPPDPSPP